MARLKGSTSDSHIGRPKNKPCTINPPIESGSTILFTDYASFRDRKQSFYYGRAGTSTHKAFEDSLNDLESAAFTELTSSGIAAISLAVLSVVGAGGHILCTDSAYDPTRGFCDGLLKTMGVETTYYDPLVGEDIRELIRPNTQAIFCESPGSLTFELQDLPAIIKAAGDVPVIVDNTYGAGVHLRPLEMGAALSLQAITKYVGGHSDLLMGAVMGTAPFGAKVRRTARLLGLSVSAQDVALAHRGLRTLHRRLDVHEQSGLDVARWLETRPEIAKVIHPGLPSHPQHDLWKRDFSGSNGLFAAILSWEDDAKTEAFIDSLKLFGLGYSWGGFESLCMPAWPKNCRSATSWSENRQLLRFHVGLEAVSDLTSDLEQAFDRAAGPREI